MKKRILIGITGGIGSGKSEAARYLKTLGENVISADDVSRELVRPGAAGYEAIRSVFGDGYFFENGELDRKKLAQCVFSDDQKRKTLNALLHPMITAEILRKASEMKGRVFIEAAVLAEAGMADKVDYVWLITADTGERIRRITERDGISREMAERIIGCQLSDERLSVYADEIIENDSGTQALRAKIDVLLGKKEYEVGQ